MYKTILSLTPLLLAAAVAKRRREGRANTDSPIVVGDTGGVLPAGSTFTSQTTVKHTAGDGKTSIFTTTRVAVRRIIIVQPGSAFP